ncbi:MAG: GMC family oxidoreductase N-terminal domain-containing protein, partial [Alphaproteobacteria bacterium]|nr:GMC family oxidoreductase N-terminal domain-containing protein [Alphaproteobacteria bacterium]
DRLSANGRYNVLVLEAGKKSNFWTQFPISFALLLDNPKANWRFRSEPEEGTANRPIPVPRGKVLGGSSAINGLVYVRGQPLDYDTWAQQGNRGWDFDTVKGYFRKLEDFERGDDGIRGEGGPIRVSECKDETPLYDAWIAACDEIGVPFNNDYNGATQEGICKTQTTIRDGKRASAAAAYLKPAMKRPNLQVEAEVLVERVLLDGKRAVGVEYSANGQRLQAKAGREVILCAGAVKSPQILELSGIGQGQLLRNLGIEVKHELWGVGESLRDHIAPRMKWKVTQRGVTYNGKVNGLGLGWQALRYAFNRRGFLGMPSAPMLAFMRTREELETPDIQLHLVPFRYDDPNKRYLGKEPGMIATVYQCRPDSMGHIHAKSADPKDAPAINFNFLAAETDRRCLLDGTKKVREFINAAALDAYRGAEEAPGEAVQGDDAMLDWIRRTAETTYHPTGTCRMGTPERNVVDERLRVHGIEGLRVIDGSIMPTLVSGNTNAACLMIGEKGADMVLEDAV